MALFETSVALAFPPEKVWDFLIRPANLPRLTPPEAGLFVINAPEILSLGSRLQFKVQGMGQVQEFLHEITAFDPQERLTETMLKGLFGKWHHEHLFDVNSNDETVVTDRIEFEPPSGLLGFLVTKKKILETLEDGFDHRQEQLKKLLG